MNVSPQPIDALLLPGMMELNVKEALGKAASLCADTRESAGFCQRLLDRLFFLRDALQQESIDQTNTTEQLKHSAQFANTIRVVIVFLKKKENKEADIATLRSSLDDHARNRSNLLTGLTESDLEEALMEIKFEIEKNKNVNDIRDLLKNVFNAVADQAEVAVLPEIPEWFIRRDDVVLADKSGRVPSELCTRASGEPRRFASSNCWWMDPRRFHGGCHVGKPFFFVSEYAMNSNFTSYLHCANNKSKMWRLFLQAAQGLAYLHGQGIVHSEIKCANLLVSDDGTAKLSDFGFSELRTLSVGISVKELPSSTRWKAPECLLEQGDGAKPSLKSDMYALAMSIIEAKIGGLPWGEMSDDDIITQLATEEGYPRPKDTFTDEEWSLVQAMTEFKPNNRITLEAAIELLQELSEEEQGAQETLELVELKSERIQCPNCFMQNPAGNKFCGECGAHLS